MDQLLILADAHDGALVAIALSTEIEEQESDYVEDDIKEVWDVSSLCRSSRPGPSALERVKYLWKFLSLPVQPRSSKATDRERYQDFC